jgi:hypothetical protein
MVGDEKYPAGTWSSDQEIVLMSSVPMMLPTGSARAATTTCWRGPVCTRGRVCCRR